MRRLTNEQILRGVDCLNEEHVCIWCGYTRKSADEDAFSVHLLKEHTGKMPLLIHKMALDHHAEKEKELLKLV